MKTNNSIITVLFVSSMLFSPTSYACDKDSLKKFLTTVNEIMGIRSTTQINVVKNGSNCNDIADDEFSKIFYEVTGSSDVEEYLKNNNTKNLKFIDSHENESSYPESELTFQNKVFNEIDTNSQILLIPDDKNKIKVNASKSNKSIIVELNFAADPKNSNYLRNYIDRFKLISDELITNIHKAQGNEYCVQMRSGSVFRMEGICLLNITVSIPNNLNILVLDKNGDRVNKSNLPMIKPELLLKLENSIGGNKIKLIKEYVKNNDPNDIFYSNDIQIILNTVSFSEKKEVLELLSPLMVRPLPIELFYFIINDISFSEKLNVVHMLSPLLQTPLSIDVVHQTIRLLGAFKELEVFKVLAPKVSKQDREKLLYVIESELSYFDQKEAHEFLRGL